jgi:hypothetical protein
MDQINNQFNGFRAIPFGTETGVDFPSDVSKIVFDPPNLSVLIATSVMPSGDVSGLQICFENVTGFRYLDELDLARYWASTGFPRGFHIIEVVGGGWSSEETVTQGWDRSCREWLVITGNGCVNVFSPKDPTSEVVTLGPDT